jgi:hypothetical protein
VAAYQLRLAEVAGVLDRLIMPFTPSGKNPPEVAFATPKARKRT